MIALISNKWDLCVDQVVAALSERGERFVRINTEDLPGTECTVQLPRFSYRVGSATFQDKLAGRLKSVWYRRPGKPFEYTPQPDQPTSQVVEYAHDQWYSFVQGLRGLKGVLWINDPGKNRDAECKILQLHVAQRIGLKIPRTCITSSQTDAIEFIESRRGRVVAKALSAPLIEYPDQDYFIFTSVPCDISQVSPHELSIAPTIFQELLAPKTDYRVTVIGHDCFSVRIAASADSSVPLDWRTAKEGLDFTPCTIPRSVSERCVKLVTELGLVFGAIDLAEAKGDYYFLEINPNGEWGWLQTQARLPIAETLAEYLSTP